MTVKPPFPTQAAERHDHVQVVTDSGADHFFRGREAPLVNRVLPFVEKQLLIPYGEAALAPPRAAAPRPTPEREENEDDDGAKEDLLTYRVRPQKGAILRAGVELETDIVAELDCGTVVAVRDRKMSTQGTWRCEIDAPRGWLSEKTLSRRRQPSARR